LLIIVDYDNIRLEQQRKGLEFIVDSILEALGPDRLAGELRVLLRLYGGWYEGTDETQRSQGLAAEIATAFPKAVVIARGEKLVKLIVTIELAYSLVVDPRNHLFHTFKRRGAPRGLHCRMPAEVDCNDPECPGAILYEFIQNGKCPKCGMKTQELLFRAEQKLVDTMMTADVIHLAGEREQDVCIVSSDADLWPAVLTALLCGRHVTQVHTRGNGTPDKYCDHAEKCYTQVFL